MYCSLNVNSLIKINEDEKEIHRILWVSEDADAVFLINIFDKSWPHEVKLSDFAIDIKENRVKFITNEIYNRVINANELSQRDINKRNKAFNVIMEFYQYIGEPNIFITSERNKYMNKVIEKHEISRRTAEDYIKRYWKRGMTPNSLLPDTYKCGGKDKNKAAGELKRGRPRVHGENNGINVDENIKKIFRTSINRFYNNQNKNSLTTAYYLMLKEYFSEKIINGKENSELIIKDRKNIPSLAQFRYWFHKERDLKKEITSRNGGRVFFQKHSAVLNTVNDLVVGPGMEYQIDATIGDVYLVSRFNKEWIIGRPVIYIVIDTYSRLVTGINVTLEGPSWVGAMGALANAMTGKVQFCKEYDIKIEEDEWPCKYIPYSIIGDRGEIAGFNADYLTDNLGIKVSNTPPYFAQWKPIVEQHFRLLNLKTKPLMPGAINPDFRLRGAKDYRYDAILNIKEFTKIVILSILYHNNHNVLKGYRREKGMIQEDVLPIPINLWNWGIKNKSGTLKTASEDFIKLSLMPRDKATITEKGIKFKGIFYSSVTAIKEGLFEIARSKKSGRIRIDVAYDPRNLNNIYWLDRSGEKYEKCFLLKKEYRYLDKTIEEIEYLRKKELLMLKNIEVDEVEKRINLIEEIEMVVNKAREEAKDIKLNSSNLIGIRANRNAEKIVCRKEDAFVIEDSVTMESANIIQYPKLEDGEDEDMMLLRNKQKGEKLNE